MAHPVDHDVTRFLSLKDARSSRPTDENIEEYRFTRVPFGVESSPFHLAATINHHLASFDSGVASDIKHDLYLHNLLTGTHDSGSASILCSTTKNIFQTSNMSLCSWSSNSEAFLQAPPVHDIDRQNVVKVLGLIWHRCKDTLAIPVPDVHQFRLLARTKCEVLHGVTVTSDPLASFSPVTLRGKLFLQDL